MNFVQPFLFFFCLIIQILFPLAQNFWEKGQQLFYISLKFNKL